MIHFYYIPNPAVSRIHVLRGLLNVRKYRGIMGATYFSPYLHALYDASKEAAPFLRPEDFKHYACVNEFLENRLRSLRVERDGGVGTRVGGGKTSERKNPGDAAK